MTEKTLVTVVTTNRFMAETIARAIDANTYHEGYYHGNGYAVIWTNGEIIEAEYKRGEKFVMNSGQDMRQMYTHHFNFRMRNYDALLGWEKSKADEAQLFSMPRIDFSSSTVMKSQVSPAQVFHLEVIETILFSGLTSTAMRE